MFSLDDLVQNTEIADTELAQPSKFTQQRFWPDLIKIFGQPIDSPNNAPTDWFVQPRQFTGSRVQNPDVVHGQLSLDLSAEQARPMARPFHLT